VARVGVTELKDHLCEHLRRVRRGAKLLMLDRDRPIAQIVPVARMDPPIRIVPARRALGPEDRRPSRAAGWPVGSVHLLLEERGEP
jgi:antitoxin (DNA-binding transcriptional repressor) of toxin-antitoxin stability system